MIAFGKAPTLSDKTLTRVQKIAKFVKIVSTGIAEAVKHIAKFKMDGLEEGLRTGLGGLLVGFRELIKDFFGADVSS